MIHAIIILSEDGEAFLFRFYTEILTQLQRQDIIAECHGQVARRSQFMSNIVEFPDRSAVCAQYGMDTRMIYRNHKGHYFLFLISASESELYTLNLIATLINSFERYYGKWWARDMVLKMDQSLLLMDEMVMDGMVACPTSSELLGVMRKIDAATRVSEKKSLAKSAEKVKGSVSEGAGRLFSSVNKKKKKKRFSVPKLPSFLRNKSKSKQRASSQTSGQSSKITSNTTNSDSRDEHKKR